MNINIIDDIIVKVIAEIHRNTAPIGLFHGDMGVCLALYMSNKRAPSYEKEKCADELLDHVVENIKFVEDPSFESGLSGIGFAINYLHKEKCIEGDIDDILYQIDASVYRHLNNFEAKISPHMNGLIGYFIYIVERLNNPYHNRNTFLHELHVSLFRLIVNKLYSYFPKELRKLNEDIFPTLLWDFPLLFFYMGKAIGLNAYNAKIVNMMKTLKFYICTIIPHYDLNKMLIANSLSFLNTKLKDANMKKHISLLYNAVDYNHIMDEIDRDMNGFYGGWCNALINLTIAVRFIESESMKSMIIKQHHNICKYSEKCVEKMLNNNKIPIDLIDGLSGLSLAYSILPEMFHNDEI